MSHPKIISTGTEFDFCVRRSREVSGLTSIRCRLGNWAVSGPEVAAEREARHYWIQYYGDGVYDELLGQLRAGPPQLKSPVRPSVSA